MVELPNQQMYDLSKQSCSFQTNLKAKWFRRDGRSDHTKKKEIVDDRVLHEVQLERDQLIIEILKRLVLSQSPDEAVTRSELTVCVKLDETPIRRLLPLIFRERMPYFGGSSMW